MATNTMEVIDRGIRCLSENIGVIETEEFISVILREKFDYTKWHQAFADRMTKEDIKELVRKSAVSSPYGGDPATVL